jgi:DNA-binding NarL/FixJ family response regulator
MLIYTTDDIEIVGEAENAEDAVQFLQKKIFDVVLPDIGLPSMNGFDLLKILHISRPNLPILMLSMYPEETYESRALKFGASGYLSKNSPLETLTSAIRTVAGGGKHFSPTVTRRMPTWSTSPPEARGGVKNCVV